MLSVWTKHLQKDPKAKEKFEQYLEGSNELFDRLQQILNEIESDLYMNQISLESFNTPNWAYAEAYKNGFKAMLRKMRILCDMKAKESE